ncbi:hypothetical protein MTR67_019958 [Solanum verrucosum]|uniref:Gag-pol polyprotein n=1 Tax=Solanum verrucosum TaxID=315347 RepID=A0AAF0TVB5_SOLVR|nr:hypothetical protein MTR67_019958 [Solanum verrucosum]
MPLRRAVRGCPASRKVEPQEQGVPNVPEVQPQGEVTNAEFLEAIRMLSQVVTNQAGQQRENRQEVADNSRVHEFLKMNPTSFTSLSKSNANRSSFQQKQKGPAPSSASAPAPRNKCEYNSQNSQNFRVRPAHSQGSVAQGGNETPAYAKCGRSHSGVCRDDSTGCFNCGQDIYFMRDCLKNMQGNGNERQYSQSSSVGPPERAAPGRATSSTGGGANHVYAITSCQEQED